MTKLHIHIDSRGREESLLTRDLASVSLPTTGCSTWNQPRKKRNRHIVKCPAIPSFGAREVKRSDELNTSPAYGKVARVKHGMKVANLDIR